MRIYKGGMSTHSFANEHGIVTNLGLDRGRILDLFSKLEFLVNEIIILKILESNSEKSFMLSDILENVDFFSRVKLLNQWKIINDSLLNLLMQTKQVRNGFAHAWDEYEVNYRGIPIRKSFFDFRDDMEKIWVQLVEIYNEEFKKIDIQKIIDKINKL